MLLYINRLVLNSIARWFGCGLTPLYGFEQKSRKNV
jgi:hypothetical protein